LTLLRFEVQQRICIEEAPDHALILAAVLAGLPFGELDAAPAQGKRHLDAFVAERKIAGRRKEVADNPNIPQWLIAVSGFLALTSLGPAAPSIWSIDGVGATAPRPTPVRRTRNAQMNRTNR
jgi:hypothetical protein